MDIGIDETVKESIISPFNRFVIGTEPRIKPPRSNNKIGTHNQFRNITYIREKKPSGFRHGGDEPSNSNVNERKI